MSGPLKLAILAGEVSGDELGGALMSALVAAVRSGAAGPAFNDVAFRGVGGETMVRAGLQPVFPMEAIAVNGFDAIVRRLPQLLGRIREAADMVVDYGPDALIIVDAPEF
ncbi:MAG: lipid-A-disaccharide synthase, partial [Pseudomonadota bacterium]